MSPSSDASKRSSENSRLAALRALTEAPGLVALRLALRISFGGFVAGIVAFAFAQAQPTILARIAVSVVPALGVMSIVLAVALAFELARQFRLAPVPLVGAALFSFVLALPHARGADAAAFFRILGGSGLFLAIVTCFAALAASLAVRRNAWIGAACAIVAFALLARTGFSLGDTLYAALQPLGRLGDSYLALLLIVVVETLLWTVGIHGPALLAAIVTPVYLALQSENGEAFAHGLPLPHIVTTSTFLFIFPGGAGATLPLVLLMLRSRLRAARVVAAATAGPAFFGINEPLLFGLPVIFEPLLAVPFVAVPVLLTATTYAAIANGLVARPAFYIPSSIPVFLNVFWATLDWRAGALLAVNIALAAAIYFPFLRVYERAREAAA